MIKLRSQFGFFVMAIKAFIILSIVYLLYKPLDIYSNPNDDSDNIIFPILTLIGVPALLLLNSLFRKVIITENEILVSCFLIKTKVYKIEDIKKVNTRLEIGGTTGGVITTIEYLTVLFNDNKKLTISSGMYYNYFELKEYFMA